VRKLEQTLGTVCRKQARRVVEGKKEKLVVTRETLKEFLGASRCAWTPRSPSASNGPASLLAWHGRRPAATSSSSKPTKMKGKGGFTMTGQIGEVNAGIHAGRTHMGSVERCHAGPG